MPSTLIKLFIMIDTLSSNTVSNNTHRGLNTIKNIIYTGVAGTGKTYLLQQIAKEYVDTIAPIDDSHVISTLINNMTWREVVCLIFLQERTHGKELLSATEVSQHPFFTSKLALNNRKDNPAKIAREILVKFSHICDSSGLSSSDNTEAVRATLKETSSNCSYFVKTNTFWSFNTEAEVLVQDLQRALNDYNSTNKATSLNSTHTVQKRYTFVSFHQSYGYDEFVEGLRPVIDKNTGAMRYQVVPGIFVQLCQQALMNPLQRYALLIDEINRANVVQVFGELMSLIEVNKRLGQSDEITINLAYSGKEFGIPSNIDVFATMNTMDYSLVQLDGAFRRRFEFIDIKPNLTLLKSIKDKNGVDICLARLLAGLNKRICATLGGNYQLGHSYFINVNNIYDLLNGMAKQIIPQILHYCQHQSSALTVIMNSDHNSWLIDELSVFDNSDTNDYVDENTESNPNVNESQQLFNSNVSHMHAINETRYIINPKIIAYIHKDPFTDIQKDKAGDTIIEYDIEHFLTALAYQQLY